MSAKATAMMKIWSELISPLPMRNCRMGKISGNGRD
jgi:hypothetical protein